VIAKRLHGRELTSARISPAQFMRTLEIKRALRLPVILNQPNGKVAGIQEAEARAVEQEPEGRPLGRRDRQTAESP
jgi:hypothetical protein